MSLPLTVVLHLPRTAGSSLRKTFQMNFRGASWLPVYFEDAPADAARRADLEPLRARTRTMLTPQTRCIFGHDVWWGVHELSREVLDKPAAPSYVTFLRDPIERSASLYFYAQWQQGSYLRPEIETFEAQNGRAPSLEEWMALESEWAWERRDGQLRHLLMGAFPGERLKADPAPLSREHLEAGKGILRKYWFAGTTETFDEDAAFLYGALGFRRFPFEKRVNAAPNRRPLSDAARAAIESHNALDIELWHEARRLRDSMKARHGRHWLSCVAQTQRRAALWNANFLRGHGLGGKLKGAPGKRGGA